MSKRLYDKLLEYKDLNMSSFHTPGHKGNFFSKYDLLSLDFTELPQTDSLYEASGSIKESEDAVSRLYGSKGSYFSSGGNTLCIQAMIGLCLKPGDKILCDRLLHRSAVSAMMLLQAYPIWLRREIRYGLPMRIDIFDLEEKLKKHKGIKAVYITSPSYHGIIQDIRAISDVCKSYAVPLLVDNAHGAHLKFLDMHPLDKGATITSDSAHKTLPVLTGGAWLHVNDDKLKNNAKKVMSIFGSTSPSYITMASMDICCKWLEKNGKKAYNDLKIKVYEIKEIASKKGMLLSDTDPTRITLCASSVGYTGFEMRDEMYKFKIQPEMCDRNYVVLITSPFNTSEDWIRLKKFLISLKVKKNYNFKQTPASMTALPEFVLSFSETLVRESRLVEVKESLNKIAAEIVCPCPPGVPVVMPGERIGALEVESLVEYGITHINVLK